jgi:hypothetical protein
MRLGWATLSRSLSSCTSAIERIARGLFIMRSLRDIFIKSFAAKTFLYLLTDDDSFGRKLNSFVSRVLLVVVAIEVAAKYELFHHWFQLIYQSQLLSSG